MIIYKVTNNINGKIYIGMTTKSLQERIIGHRKSYKQTQYAFHRALRKYGFENFYFEEIDNTNNLDELILKESIFIDKYDSMNPKIGYNMIRQDNHLKYYNIDVKNKLSDSHKKRMSEMNLDFKKEIYEKSSRTRQGKKRNNNKKYVGVFGLKNSNSFECSITFNKKRYRKLFLEEIEAATAYDRLSLYMYGELAKLNFPEMRENYLKEDLELFVDYFLNHELKQGRRPKKTYRYDELIEESKTNAHESMYKYLQNQVNFNLDESIKILNSRFLYDGTLI